MRRQFGCIFLGLLLGATTSVVQAAPDRWVSDDLSTWVRSGPSDNYRIVGTVNSGDPVTLLETQGDYSHIRSNDGDEVWIKSADLQSEPSVQKRLPALQSKVEDLTGQLDGINSKWQNRVASMKATLEARQSRIDELQKTNDSLNEQLTSAQSEMRKYRARLDTERNDLLMRYFLYGGGVAGAGLVLGLLVPHLPRRRKRRDRWF
ncbi:TIGR04211 family SH3 domain-containing protein [Kushneria phosphatilytica]|uniref:SH3 domain-containing protein n=1 Tax=Kushneria phosphatilytica TaxID=657387 RepID=A0A1S1NXL2_9GAMM|nr:TIGR04211 family SH3 domain-containing protein [Kushneria phosphatilytica]OHV12312.1 peptide-binding protein [Kushneria phosphatilytica]QEL11518.1 SH3 domain-containing protein [Kushneria phosphatilytica]